MKINLASNEIIHFIGIGGIGMSGLAQIMNNMGFLIQGSDLSQNKNTERLIKLGIKVQFGHSKKNLKKATMVVISSAIKNNNEELIASKNKKLPIFTRGEMLANIVSLKKNIVITGSHGKTTTTSLIANILVEAGLDPTVINGGVINSLKNNAQLGKGEWGVIESDESDGSFLKLPITYSIVTNLDKEHLDFYGSFEKLKKSFCTFIEKTPSFGKSFICIDNKNCKEILKKVKNKNFHSYGLDKKSSFRIINISQNKKFSKFDLKISLPGKKTTFLRDVKVPIIGIHNIRNATAAAAVAFVIGISNKKIKLGLKNFKGVQRRFNILSKNKDSIFVDDYAHHPTEIKASIEISKQLTKGKTIVIFQPHRYSRTKDLYDDFMKIFKKIEVLFVCDIYPAGEKPINNIHSIKIVKDLNLDISVVGGETIREEGGLAMSSRNSRLTAKQRKAAAVIHSALSEAIGMWESGVTDSVALRSTVEKVVSTEPLAKLDYVSICDVETLDELNNVGSGAMISVAVWFDDVRLIDNELIGG